MGCDLMSPLKPSPTLDSSTCNCQSSMTFKTTLLFSSLALGGIFVYYLWNRSYAIQPTPSDFSSTLYSNQRTTSRAASKVFSDSHSPPAQIGLSLSDSEEIDTEETSLQATSSNSNNYHDYLRLALDLNPKDKVVLPSGEKMTKKDLLLTAIEKNQNNPDYRLYLELGSLLSELREKTIQLISGKTLSRQQLYITALLHNPTCSQAYCELAEMLGEGCAFMISNQQMTKKILYVKAIESDPTCARAFYHLSMLIPDGKSVKFQDGTEMTSEELKNKAETLNPHVHGFVLVESVITDY